MTQKLLIALLIFTLGALTVSAYAQDDLDTESDNPSIVPNPNTNTPPVIMDESDSSGVSDVEEYDG